MRLNFVRHDETMGQKRCQKISNENIANVLLETSLGSSRINQN